IEPAQKLRMMYMYGGDNQVLNETQRLGRVDTTIAAVYGITAALTKRKVEMIPANIRRSSIVHIAICTLLLGIELPRNRFSMNI
ncbi:unnamed protein product, partial [Ilex paraguariensis]